MCVYIYVYIYIYTHADVCVCVRVCVGLCMCAHAYCIDTKCIHACMHAYVHKYIQHLMRLAPLRGSKPRRGAWGPEPSQPSKAPVGQHRNLTGLRRE